MITDNLDSWPRTLLFGIAVLTLSAALPAATMAAAQGKVFAVYGLMFVAWWSYALAHYAVEDTFIHLKRSTVWMEDLGVHPRQTRTIVGRAVLGILLGVAGVAVGATGVAGGRHPQATLGAFTFLVGYMVVHHTFQGDLL